MVTIEQALDKAAMILDGAHDCDDLTRMERLNGLADSWIYLASTLVTAASEV